MRESVTLERLDDIPHRLEVLEVESLVVVGRRIVGRGSIGEIPNVFDSDSVALDLCGREHLLVEREVVVIRRFFRREQVKQAHKDEKRDASYGEQGTYAFKKTHSSLFFTAKGVQYFFSHNRAVFNPKAIATFLQERSTVVQKVDNEDDTHR